MNQKLRNSIRFFIALIFAYQLTGCAKEELLDVPTPPVAQGSFSPSDFINNARDAVEQNVNQCIYDIGIAARSILVQPSVFSDLVKASNTTTHHQVDLLDFFDAIGKREVFRQNLAAQTGNNEDDFDDEAYIADNLVYDQAYRAKLMIYNLASMDPDYTPIIMPTLQVDEDIYPELPDDYLIWTKTSSSFSMSVLDETDASDVVAPIILIGNGEELDGIDIVQLPEYHLEKLPVASDRPLFGVTSCQVNHRYEESGNSEFRIQIVDASILDMSSTPGAWSIDVSLTATQCTTAAIFYINRRMISDPDNLLTSCNSSFASYERDWGSIPKILLYWCQSGSNPGVAVPRRFSNEWYHRNPYIIGQSGYNFRGLLPTNLSTTTQNDGKGVMTLQGLY